RPLRGEARRGLLLEAALRVIAAEGPSALTHRRVAAEAELPLAATTYWFSSKDEILIEAYRLAAARDVDRLRNLADFRALPTAAIGPAFADLIADELDHHRAATMASFALWLEAARRPELRGVEREWAEEYAAVIRDVLVAAGARDPDSATRILVSTLDGLMLAELAADRPTPRAELRALVGRLVEALLPS
ncbi:MAG TPA: TetR family transcriptional regulator C-terminal domain-containing protein, partial [Solirubrobacteraceae bacterium]|nr:TetR family transcriptional regulator C-terminal domain-containing protein [Solirubrobacteraceae bacterium]